MNPMEYYKSEKTGGQGPEKIDEHREDKSEQAVPRAACAENALDHELVAHLVKEKCFGLERFNFFKQFLNLIKFCF